MEFAERMLRQPRPTRIRDLDLPRRQSYYASPDDWRDAVLYFLLPDRFSDGQEAGLVLGRAHGARGAVDDDAGPTIAHVRPLQPRVA